MSFTKRKSSSLSQANKRNAKSRQTNTPPELPMDVDVIEISSGDETEALNPLQYKPASSSKAKGKRKVSELSDSEVEILDDAPRKPSPAKRARTSTAAIQGGTSSSSSKGKGKAKAVPSSQIVYDVDAILSSGDDEPSTSQPKNKEKQEEVYDITSSEPSDLDPHGHFESDEALARRLQKEWEEQDERVEAAHPSNAGPSSSSHFPTSAQRSTTTNSNGKTSKTPLDIPVINLPLPNPSSLAELKSLVVRVGECSKCKKAVRAPRGQVIFEYPPGQEEGFPPSLGSFVHAPCSSKACGTNHCRGCLSALSCPAKCTGPVPGSSCEALNCCAEGRAIALFEVLSAFDELYLAEKATSETRAKANLKNSKGSGSGSVGPGGTGYGTGSLTHHHHGYTSGRGRGRGRGRGITHFTNGGRVDAVEPIPPSPSTSNTNAAHWDQTMARALTLIRDLLPSPCSDTPAIYDLLPHPSLASLILMSYTPTILAQLLRNDSVTDWIARKQVYHAMLALLRRMADSELVIQVLIGRRPEIAQSPGVGSCLRDGAEIGWQRTTAGEIEMAPPLLEYFRKLTKQSETFLQAASQHMTADGEDEGFIDGLSLCGDIIAGRDDIARAMAVAGSVATPSSSTAETGTSRGDQATSSGNTNQPNAKGKGRGRPKKALDNKEAFDIEKDYIASCERLCFKHTALSTEDAEGNPVYDSYYYAKDLTATQNATRMPKDRLHLAKELAVMATSLPPGIWVRVDDVRNDAIKVMIAGPQGTPYAGGLFEFDVFMPLTYPNSPPLVHLRTTGRGSVRFNPNLYSCGKVCLSLLGTWPGSPEEQWTPKSTLLQVLVSIQSMILIDAPYFNEPGHGKANPKSPASISYNRNIALQTVRWAMVDWLSDEHRHGIWADVIKSHFTVLEDKIRKQIREWAVDIPTLRKYTQVGQQSSSMNFGDMYLTPSFPAGGSMVLPPVPGSKYGYGGRNPAAAAAAAVNAPKTRDLVEEFEMGMKRLEGWTTADEDNE